MYLVIYHYKLVLTCVDYACTLNEKVSSPSVCYAACKDDGAVRIANSLEELRDAMADQKIGAIVLTTDVVLDKEISGEH